MTASLDQPRKKQRRIVVVTTTRADWSLLRPVAAALSQREKNNSGLRVSVLAGGTHLLDGFGNTIEQVRSESACPVEIVDFIDNTRVRSDDHREMAHTMSRALDAFSTAFERIRPDIVVILGDRFEIMAAALACVCLRIPLAHLEGGHVSLGAIDERFRHAVTKLADVHYVAITAQRDRLLALAESGDRIVVTGAIGAENILRSRDIASGEVKSLTGFDPEARRIFVATIHPETASGRPASACIDCVFGAIEDVLNSQPSGRRPAFLFTSANLDPGGDAINKALRRFSARLPDDVHIVPSLGAEYYGAVLKKSVGVIGNSSSGLFEAPVLGVPVINIGDRQKGRDRYGPVTDVGWDRVAIAQSISNVLAETMMEHPRTVAASAGPHLAARIIADDLATRDLSALGVKQFPSSGRTN